MSFPIQDKLVVAVSSSALFNLEEADKIYRKYGVERYKEFQINNRDNILQKGKAFPFIRRLLGINEHFENRPIEVVVLSRNSPESGLRISQSIRDYKLDISRFAFTAGKNPCVYMDAFNVSLFLSTNKADVDEAIAMNLPAGEIIESEVDDDPSDRQLRVAFDFDSVLADDTSERSFKAHGEQLEMYLSNEEEKKYESLPPGPLQNFFVQLSAIQAQERQRQLEDQNYSRIIETSIVTARNAPADQRAIYTLLEWGVDVDNMFLLGGIDKSSILKVLKPHVYFDDQLKHLDSSLKNIPMVHIPFGIRNLKD